MEKLAPNEPDQLRSLGFCIFFSFFIFKQTTNVSRDACSTTPMHKSWLDTLDADIGQLALRLFVFEMNPNSIRYGTVLLSRPHPIGQTWPIQGRTANPHHCSTHQL
ncbi:3-isopropylmalate dehydratase large subunit [Trichinella spiralis]|uniref:3-isopropylmalate dehydratase large subunit n=1 Tax=Trichinella spiralis TaxID=6334 RepID=A0ABR3K3Y3_TRISP